MDFRAGRYDRLRRRPAHRSRPNRTIPAAPERKTGYPGSESDFPDRRYPSAGHPLRLRDTPRTDTGPGARIPRDGRCGRNGPERERCPYRCTHLFPVREEQEASTGTIATDGLGGVRHPGCGRPLLYLYQYLVLRDAGLCRTTQAASSAGPPQPVRLC